MKTRLHRIPRLLRTHHFKLAIIAAALATLSLFISLTAYLTTYTDEPYEPTFRTATGAEFGLSITGLAYENDVVYPGQEIDLSPTITASSPMYVFAEVSLDDLEMSTLSDDWHLMSEENGVGLYYYGGSDGVQPLSSSSILFTTVKVPTSIGTNETFEPSVVAYGIQTDGITGRPVEIWQQLVGSMEDGE